jgi:hypothetical protein
VNADVVDRLTLQVLWRRLYAAEGFQFFHAAQGDKTAAGCPGV